MKRKLSLLLLSAALAAMVGCGQKADSPKTAALGKPMTDEPIQPINAANVTNPALVHLGMQLYFDPVCRNRASFRVTPATTCPWGYR